MRISSDNRILSNIRKVFYYLEKEREVFALLRVDGGVCIYFLLELLAMTAKQKFSWCT